MRKSLAESWSCWKLSRITELERTGWSADTWLSHCRPEGQNDIRRALRCKWESDEPARWLVWLMLNPSWAAEEHDDTTKRVTYYTMHWPEERFDGWIAVNLSPQVNPDGASFSSGTAGLAEAAKDDNLLDIAEAGAGAAKRVVAYGVSAIKSHRALVWSSIDALVRPVWCLGVNGKQQPYHPKRRAAIMTPSELADKVKVLPERVLGKRKRRI